MSHSIDSIQQLPATISRSDAKSRYAVTKQISLSHGCSQIGMIQKSSNKWQMFCCGIDIGFSRNLKEACKFIDNYWMSHHSKASLDLKFQQKLFNGVFVGFIHSTDKCIVATSRDNHGDFQASWDLKGNFSLSEKGDKSMNLIPR